MRRRKIIVGLLLVISVFISACSSEESGEPRECRNNADCPIDLPICNSEGFCTSQGQDAPNETDGDLELDNPAEIDEDELSDTPTESDIEQNSEIEAEFEEIDEAEESREDVEDLSEDDRDFLDDPTEGDDIEMEDSDALERDEELLESEPDSPFEMHEDGSMFWSCCSDGNMHSHSVRCGLPIVKRCDGSAPDGCGGAWQYAQATQYCTGDSCDCEGEIRNYGRWHSYDFCRWDQQCDPDIGCIDAEEICVQCNDEDGPCCEDGRYLSEEERCLRIEYEEQCYWGEEPGDNVAYRSIEQFCSGESAVCDGEIVETDWSTSRFCFPNERCSQVGNGFECIPVDCLFQSNCPDDHVCRDGKCERLVASYCWEECDDTTRFYCNQEYHLCLSLRGPCEADMDCIDSPTGEICDPVAKMCIAPPACDVNVNNCRPGTQCTFLNEFQGIGYQGNYCINCNDDSDCYEGLHCDDRFLLPNVCTD